MAQLYNLECAPGQEGISLFRTCLQKNKFRLYLWAVEYCFARLKVKIMLFKTLIRPVVFRISSNDPETAHHLIMNQLALASRIPLLLKIIEAANAYISPTLER